ncbi:MAG: hypothetical protein WBX01_03975 [Nitrososphaeraceae archaeon]
MRNCKAVIKNFLTVCISLLVWTWLNSLHRNCHIHYDDEKLARTCTVGIVSGLLIILFSPLDSSADLPMGGLQQRIGNYDISVKTDPSQPQTGTTVKILIAIAAVNGDDISGIPADITIKGDGTVLSGLNRPIAVPYGHYTYQYKFEKPGIYSLVVDIYDIYFTGRQVSFTFPIEVKSPFFGLWGASDMMGYVLIPSIVITVSTILVLFIWRKHKTKLKSILHDDKR